MRISDIKPYERNARHNEKAVPVVAESIKEFGLRGQIVLESRENPVIVCGHTRVEACKLLGWDEIPDESIDFCDGLTDEQIRAFRIADNKAGDVATYNRSMLREEVRGIRSLDMSRFNVDFKSKVRPYGAERLKTDRAYNLDLVGRSDCPAGGYPSLPRVDAAPAGLVGFNFAKSMAEEEKRGQCCHFFIDDYQFERCWTQPQVMGERLRGFDCVLTPDFSLYMDMPGPMQRWNRYRSQAVGLIWSRMGLKVVPTLSWAQEPTFEWCFNGIGTRSTVATSSVGVKGDAAALDTWFSGMDAAMRQLQPKRLLLYGGNPGFDFDRYTFGCEVVEFAARGFGGTGWAGEDPQALR